MKTCSRCGQTKPLDQFPLRRPSTTLRQSWCRQCFAENNKRYYREHRDAQKARLIAHSATRRAENIAKLIEYLRDHPCVDCGERDIVVLEFDHVGPKRKNVAALFRGSPSWERIASEIAQCEVRCANCHRKRTARTSGWQRAGTPSTTPRRRQAPVQLLLDAILGAQACRVCGKEKPLSDFPFRSVARQTRQWICLACQRAYSAAWYARNRQRAISGVREGERRRRRIAKEFVAGVLKTRACVDCGEADPLLLDFDHLRDKRFEVSALVRHAASTGVIAAEIAKCEVRCANCHRRKTAQERGWYRAKATA